ncbi:MAG: acyl-[ACP]--phospholipid O-acyltransferase [Oceanospirillaceae bacterium]|nr:acyl-[ACP]--phospholipid O-acyltransferase [Oceanospirillaceae bacterium]
MGLLASQRFLPLFLTQYFGAFNDNFFKNSLLVFIMFAMVGQTSIDSAMLMPLGAGLFIFPFFLFSALAGQLSDRFEKATLIKGLKGLEVLIMGLGATALHLEAVNLMMGTLFLMGTQSAFFGPLKYAILPELLQEDELVTGNAWIEAGTFLSILLGTIAGGLLIMLPDGALWVSAGLLAVAVCGFLASLFIVNTHVRAPDLAINPNILGETIQIIRDLRANRTVFLAVIGISWFWFVGATFLSQFPTFSKDLIGGDEKLVTLFMTVFSIGIGIGSWLCAKLLKGKISANLVPLSAIFMAVFCVDLYYASTAFGMEPVDAMSVSATAFASSVQGARILIDLTLLAIAGGLYIVPLYSIIQVRSAEHERARMVAANNILNAFFMVVSSVVLMAVFAFGGAIHDAFLLMAGASVVVAIYICGLLPRQLFRSLAVIVFKTLFKVEVHGASNFQKAGDRAVIVANHVSWLDGPLMAAFGPEDALFPINTFVFKKWWGGLSRKFANMIPVDPSSPYATKTMIKAVEEGNHLMIFPEGRLTVTGSLMKIYDGPALIADKARVKIVPVRLDGVQFSKLSRLKGKMPVSWFPKITITVLEPVTLEVPEAIRGRERRKVAGQKLYDLMSEMMFATSSNLDNTLFNALLDAKAVYGPKHQVLEDPQTMAQPVPYQDILKGSFVLGRYLSRSTDAAERVGVLLPNSVGTVVTFFALQAFGRVPAMLNFTMGPGTLVAACETAQVRTVLTSRRFVEMGNLTAVIEALSEQVSVCYLEDLKDQLSLSDKVKGLLSGLRPRTHASANPDAPAVVLFTSGSEGAPKGVVLSHRNLLANLCQIGARVSFNTQDIIFNAMPMFHSFGLTGGTLLPVLSGLKTFLYPSPLHYKIVPELIYETNATVVFGTDTFLSNYAKKANPYDFYNVRYIIAGAEKVKAETRAVYMERFMKGILEGYGATETAPVIAVNTPMHNKAGTVGRLLPGIEARLEPVPGVERGGRLWVKGPNIMLGYFRHDQPGVLQPPEEGWYDTGDIVDIDDLGYVEILGRAKRFAKVAGEMVSLTQVEAMISKLWPDDASAVVSIPDPKKGEQLVLFTTRADAERQAISAHIKGQGGAELMVPRDIRVVDKLPVLGTGKTDYVSLGKMALED